MADDPNAPPLSNSASSSTVEAQNRPEPVADVSVSASESAETQPQPTPESAKTAAESANAATEELQVQPTPSTEAVAPSPSQQPEGETVSQSTQPVSEPPTMPPAQQSGTPETDQEKPENQEPQATTEPHSQPGPEAPQPQATPSPTPSASSSPSIPPLHYPFYGSYPITFDFGAQPTEENVKKKYEEWGIVGHNGIDFELQEGTEVLACDEGTIIQAGDNGDHGISVTIKHSWGTSIYSHLQSFGVLVNDQVKKAQVIGLSGQTGFTTGPHLHFGIEPGNPDTNNGYLGYINPAPYLTEASPLPQSPLPAEASPQEGVSPRSPQTSDLSGDLSEEKPIEPQPQEQQLATEPPKVEPPQTPVSPLFPQSPQSEISQEEIQKQAVAMFDARIKENSIKGNQAKRARRDEAIQKIYSFAQEKKLVTNEQIRDLLHVSQSTASDYLSDLVNRGMLKTE